MCSATAGDWQRLARRAANLSNTPATNGNSGSPHQVDARSDRLTEEDLQAVAAELGVPGADSPASDVSRRARERVDADSERGGERRDHADVLHQWPPLRRPVGRELALRSACCGPSATACAPPRSTSLAGRPRPAFCCCATTAARRVARRNRAGPDSEFWERAAGSVFWRHRLCDVAAPLGQRRSADHLLPRRRPGDQARVHGRASRQPTRWRRCRSRLPSAAWSCPR